MGVEAPVLEAAAYQNVGGRVTQRLTDKKLKEHKILAAAEMVDRKIGDPVVHVGVIRAH
jgi:hypothetical protein